MKLTGITRHVDRLDRIVIPKELCKTLEIAPKTALELYVDGTSIVMKKHTTDEGVPKKNTGIVRHVDDLGRVVIPKETCRALKIEPKDELEIYVNDEEIILKKVQVKCVFCDSIQDVLEYKNQVICKECIKEIKTLI